MRNLAATRSPIALSSMPVSLKLYLTWMTSQFFLCASFFSRMVARFSFLGEGVGMSPFAHRLSGRTRRRCAHATLPVQSSKHLR